MENLIGKREFLAASVLGLGMGIAGAAFGQPAAAAAGAPPPGGRARREIPNRMAKTSVMFKTPQGFPNAIAVAPEGLWIGEQKEGRNAAPGADTREAAWLVD